MRSRRCWVGTSRMRCGGVWVSFIVSGGVLGRLARGTSSICGGVSRKQLLRFACGRRGWKITRLFVVGNVLWWGRVWGRLVWGACLVLLRWGRTFELMRRGFLWPWQRVWCVCLVLVGVVFFGVGGSVAWTIEPASHLTVESLQSPSRFSEAEDAGCRVFLEAGSELNSISPCPRYQVNVTNTGSKTLSGEEVTVSDTLPVGVVAHGAQFFWIPTR